MVVNGTFSEKNNKLRAQATIPNSAKGKMSTWKLCLFFQPHHQMNQFNERSFVMKYESNTCRCLSSDFKQIQSNFDGN